MGPIGFEPMTNRLWADRSTTELRTPHINLKIKIQNAKIIFCAEIKVLITIGKQISKISFLREFESACQLFEGQSPNRRFKCGDKGRNQESDQKRKGGGGDHNKLDVGLIEDQS